MMEFELTEQDYMVLLSNFSFRYEDLFSLFHCSPPPIHLRSIVAIVRVLFVMENEKEDTSKGVCPYDQILLSGVIPDSPFFPTAVSPPTMLQRLAKSFVDIVTRVKNVPPITDFLGEPLVCRSTSAYVALERLKQHCCHRHAREHLFDLVISA